MDFGLAKPWLDERTRQPLPQRPDAAFRGSTTYASGERLSFQERKMRRALC